MFTPIMHGGIAVKNNILSDNRRIEINSASNSSIVIFSRFNLFENTYLAPWIGYMNNRQIGISDYGYYYGLEGFLIKSNLNEYEINSTLKFINEDITPRKNLLRNIKFSLINRFDNQISNHLSIGYYQNKRDFYYRADSITANDFSILNNIQSRIETHYQFTNSFSYLDLFPNFSVNFIATVNWRNINRNTKYKSLKITSPSIFDSKIDELRFEVESILNFKSDEITSELRCSYSERDERHAAINFNNINKIFFDERMELESQKNNLSQTLYLILISNYHLTKKDMISLNLMHFKLKYDTPAITNYDDRDELLSILKLKYLRIISPFFQAFVTAEGNLSELTYISSKKSSNNNINRIIKLASGGEYRNTYLTSFNSFEVSANYTVYKFEDITPNYKSYSYRQFSIVDSSAIKITDAIKIKLYGFLKLSEQGELKWKAFALKPTRYLEEYFIVPTINYSYKKIDLSFGLRYFSLKTFIYKSSIKQIESFYSSIGPTTEIIYTLYTNTYLHLNGWYEFINLHKNIDGSENANLLFEVNWFF
jgi:hypothetical protein